jgi:hypothetical protein
MVACGIPSQVDLQTCAFLAVVVLPRFSLDSCVPFSTGPVIQPIQRLLVKRTHTYDYNLTLLNKRKEK